MTMMMIAAMMIAAIAMMIAVMMIAAIERWLMQLQRGQSSPESRIVNVLC